jgi:type 1 glutamine amidotransferase
MARIRIWGGGPYHPTRAQAAFLKERWSGHDVAYTEERSAFSAGALASTDLLVLSGMDESVVCPAAEAQYWETPLKAPFQYQPLSEEHFQATMGYLAQGKPLLIHHSGLLSFDERKELNAVYDGRWVRGESFHPPFQEFKVTVHGPHPSLRGLRDFRIADELYCRLLEPKERQVLMSAVWEGVERPLAWAGNWGKSKVLFSGLGHDLRSYACPELIQFLANSVDWLLAP